MFLLFSPVKLIATLAGIYAAILLLLLPFTTPIAAFRSATLFEFALLFIIHFGWRIIWEKFPRLNYLLFPDLNGDWIAQINWIREESYGKVSATAEIKQNFFNISIELQAPDSESSTIVLVARKDPESGRPILHYVYEVTEKQIRPGAERVYRGAASLKVDTVNPKLMQGNYFTERGGKGHFSFSRKIERNVDQNS